MLSQRGVGLTWDSVRGTQLARMICPEGRHLLLLIAMAPGAFRGGYRQIILGYQRWPPTSMRDLSSATCGACCALMPACLGMYLLGAIRHWVGVGDFTWVQLRV